MFDEIEKYYKTCHEIVNKLDLKKELPDELSDVLFVLICIANQTGVDLSEAFRKNLEKKTKRDSNRHKKNPAL